MQTTNFRYQYHLHRRKIILLILFFVPAFVFSQRNVMENDMKFARKPYHFGIHLSGGFTDFKIKHNELFATSDSVLAIKSKYGVDFGIGALISYHINKYVELRTTPGFLFSNKQLNYTFANASTDKKEIPQVFFELPVEFKINGRNRKMILKDAFKDELPSEIFNRGKHGFEVPLLKWMRHELQSLINDDLLNKKFIQQQNIFNYSSIDNLKRQLMSNNPGEATARIWALIVFQYWYKRNFS